MVRLNPAMFLGLASAIVLTGLCWIAMTPCPGRQELQPHHGHEADIFVQQIDPNDLFPRSTIWKSLLQLFGHFPIPNARSPQGQLRTASFVTVTKRRKAPTEKGVSFTRNIVQFPADASLVMDLNGEHCMDRDEYGDNSCHYEWGDDFTGNYTVHFDQDIQEGDYVVGDIKIDKFIPYSFQCALCGEDCVLHIPIINVHFTIHMPPDCPLSLNHRSESLQYKLWDQSPTEGTVVSTLHGTISVVQARTGQTLAQFTFDGVVK